jgi:hypothetical protein
MHAMDSATARLSAIGVGSAGLQGRARSPSGSAAGLRLVEACVGSVPVVERGEHDAGRPGERRDTWTSRHQESLATRITPSAPRIF